MRVGFVFALVVVTLIACFNGLASAEGAVVANNQRLDSINGLISRDITRRNLRATATTNGEERGWATSFTEKIGNLFKSNPGLSQKVETLQKNPTLVKNLEKATFTQKGSSKVRAWFMNMYNNSSKRDKFFILATLIMFPIGSTGMEDVEVIDASNNEVDKDLLLGELSLTIPPLETSPTSRNKSETSPRSPKRSPVKQHANLLNIDPSSTLAAISARLAVVIPPAESEIARINREVLAAMANRVWNAKNQGNSPRSPGGRQESDQPAPVSDSTLSSSPTSKGGMTPALYDSVISEEWVNRHLETCGAFLLPASDIVKSPTVDELDLDPEAFAFRKGGDGGPLGRAGMDRYSLYQMGMPKDLVDRLYRALYVYTNGFHNIINEIAAHCPPRFEKHVSSNAWLTFLLLLEQCENGKYEMAMLKFKQAAENTQNQLQDDFQQEKQYLNAQLHITESALKEETSRGNEKSELILKLVTETTESNLKMAEQQHQIAAQAEHIRLLKLEVLVHEDEEKKLNELLDDTRRDYEVANSERLNALSERYALDEEIRKLSSQLERVEAEKANYAKRMHETLFMNQALRANNDQLKQDLVVQGMEKDKVIVEKQGLQEQVEKMREGICRLQELKAQVDKELIETQRKQSHLEARFQTVKEQFDIEAENSAKHQQEIVRLAAQNDEERVQVGVLEAKCNLLAAEKQNTGMRAQDKLRIERLLNQKMELEAIVEANKVDKKKDEEQIWTLRTSLEALDNELQHNKRVYSAGQQAFLHSERTCEQLRLQNQELEKNYEKTKKNVMSLKERFKVYETAAKEQITKLEVEVKVANAQLREITYVNKDNVAQIEQLTKTLSLSEKEATVLRTHIKESEMHVVELQTEKEDLQRNQNEQALANSTSKNAVTRFILSLQNMLALVKLDEFPLDEAIRELLLMIQDTFGEELNIENVLGEDDKPVEIELEVQEDVTDEERTSRQKRADARRQGIISIEGCDDDDEEEAKEASEDAQREIIRMSRFRKSKLDHLVNKLQRDIALKADLIANLESVVVEQNRQISQLTTTTRQQSRVIMQVECQKGMLQSDLEMTTLSLFEVRAEKRAVEFTLDQVRIDHVLRANRAFQVEVALATLRREFDMQVIVYEDLMGKIGRKYEHDEYMRSLRRNKEVQASVTVTDQPSQTLVPQRNPALERPRVPSQYIPTDATGSSETLLQKISRATRELLPGVANEMDLHFTVGKSPKRSSKHQHKHSLVRPLASSPRSSRTQLRAQASQDESRRRHPGKNRSTASTSSEAGTSTLPLLDDKTSGMRSSPSQMIHHVNEFGTRQTVLLSPARPPYFAEQSPSRSRSPRPPALQSPQVRKPVPPKLSANKRPQFNHLQLDTQYEERVESAEYTPRSARQSAHSPIRLPIPRQSSPSTSTSTLRYNRNFVRAGMEVLRATGSSASPLLYPNEVDSDDSDDDLFSEDEGDSDDCDPALSPSRLAAAVRGYHREQRSLQEAAWRETQSPRRTVNSNNEDKQNDLRTGTEINAELSTQDQHSPFTQAVLYPILPNQ
ncbi:hypothetical protein PC129_g2889 [Phytophthora cactorum]|uniref:Uncharacterized protein n=2 Tax=Phytophthora cactorum TaxID=29920 RepID=A0A8T1GIR4_9STRA|nr:hypothetical protein Pcac1_g22517 [Phytophthora cactorum]KAG2843405.1 hypothetical protein PC112_g2635 [Phytophthora cactorum]KAG2845427.1 hypothetical protein PC111_g1557 [Phytophthora cactorum]KAG2867421.1 hypothetical protein PC113_g1961 [Phytophthora cactorum]KAG2930355.1 hypothetical protein PC114_g2496 [Phytophthora cactorum]